LAASLTLAQQESLLVRWDKRIKPWYDLSVGYRWLCFRYSLQPTPTCGVYEVLFAYCLGVRPHVYVKSPEPVREAHGQRTPHLNNDGTLCLYDPAKAQWTGADPLIYTVVPWTTRWLFHYENWLAFGEWRGDHDPSTIEKQDGAGPAATGVGS
jgi:hypothetical protein